MSLDKEIAKIAALIGDKTRAKMLIALMEGKALTSGELAIRSNISPQTASNHLKKLMEAQLIEVIKTPTRYRYYKITSPLVAKALESLSLLAKSPKKHPPRHEKLDKEICFARTCYDHLAGELGVKITKSLLSKKMIGLKNEIFILTEAGDVFFKKLGIDCSELLSLRRRFAAPCLDWTEREYHLAGSLGKALLDYLLKNRLVIRSTTKPRVIVLTVKGKQWLQNVLGLS